MRRLSELFTFQVLGKVKVGGGFRSEEVFGYSGYLKLTNHCVGR